MIVVNVARSLIFSMKLAALSEFFNCGWAGSELDLSPFASKFYI